MTLRNAFGDLNAETTQQTIEYLLSAILNRLSSSLQPNTGGYLRVDASSNTVPISVAAMGGLTPSYDQIGQMMQGAMLVRAGITVS